MMVNNTTKNHDTFLSMDLAAKELGVSTQTLRKMCWNGTGPATTRLSEKRLGIRRDTFDAWLEARTGHHRPNA